MDRRCYTLAVSLADLAARSEDHQRGPDFSVVKLVSARKDPGNVYLALLTESSRLGGVSWLAAQQECKTPSGLPTVCTGRLLKPL